MCWNAFSNISEDPTRCWKMEFPEKQFLRENTVGIYIYFCLGNHWVPLNRTHFFEKKCVILAFSGFWWALPGKETRLGQKSLFLQAFKLGFDMRFFLNFIDFIDFDSLFSQKRCVEMRFSRIWVTLSGVARFKRRKSENASVYIGILHVVGFQKIHEHLLEQRPFWWEFHFCPAGRPRFRFFRRVRRKLG